jgi:hypothetical protein
MAIDRVAVNRALAKALAYKACDKGQLAEAWAAELVRLLECADIIDPNYIQFASKRSLVIAPESAWPQRVNVS